MNKLIELHKKFIKEKKEYMIIYYNEEYKCFCFDCCDSFYDFSEGAVEYLISKSYGFIEWLVKNGKVKEQREIEEYRIYSQVELLLINLAISDNPLKVLIDNLK